MRRFAMWTTLAPEPMHRRYFSPNGYELTNLYRSEARYKLAGNVRRHSAALPPDTAGLYNGTCLAHPPVRDLPQASSYTMETSVKSAQAQVTQTCPTRSLARIADQLQAECSASLHDIGLGACCCPSSLHDLSSLLFVLAPVSTLFQTKLTIQTKDRRRVGTLAATKCRREKWLRNFTIRKESIMGLEQVSSPSGNIRRRTK